MNSVTAFHAGRLSAGTLLVVHQRSLVLAVILGGVVGPMLVVLPAPAYSLAYVAAETLAVSIGPCGIVALRPAEPAWPAFLIISAGAGLALAAPVITFFNYPVTRFAQRIGAAAAVAIGESGGGLAGCLALPLLTAWYPAAYSGPVWTACDPARYVEAAFLFVIASGLGGTLLALFVIRRRSSWPKLPH